MSFKLPSLPKARTKDLYERITAGLETFSWSELSDISEIDRGTFGSVLLASFSNATGRLATSEKVVVKKLLPSSRSDEKQRFFKEARFLQGINHKNVVPFKRLCTLEDFLGYLDETEAVDALPPCLYRKIAHDVANGLKYLHESNVYHRDLKTSNMLVSNTHYCDMGDNDELLAAFNVEPIVCKLTDFGESRSEQIQTQLIANTRTSNVDRGTPSFMAPEIHTLREVGAEDLKRIDMWAYGMRHCLI